MHPEITDACPADSHRRPPTGEVSIRESPR
jgi:hypothetical protein